MRNLIAVVFSKDRALQCHGLLRSLRDHWTIPVKDVWVIYKATSGRFTEGYSKAIERSSGGVIWQQERGGFRSTLEQVLSSYPEDTTDVVWFTDDDIVYQPLVKGPEVYAQWDPERHLFLSTRLDRGFLLAHNDGIPPDAKKTPEFTRETEEFLEWEWKKAPWSPWNYSFSVEGTIYSLRLLNRMHRGINYQAPNTYECEGANWCNHSPGVPSLALSPVQACTFGNNINITQTEWLTPVGKTWSMEKLNDAWLDSNQELNLQWFYDHAVDITDCHHIIEASEILTP